MFGYIKISILDVAKSFTGLTYKPSDVKSEGTLVLRSSNIKNNRISYTDNVYVQMNNIPERAIAKENDILVCVRNGSRSLIGKSALIPKTEKPMAFGAFMTILRADKYLVLPKFLFYAWQSSYVQKQVRGDEAMPINQITNKVLKNTFLYVPSMEIQNSIVKQLDKLEKLSFDLFDGLPAEIEARQKQYEYYRNKLLNFKPLEH